MRIRMGEGAKHFLETLGMIKLVNKPDKKTRPESPTQFNKDLAERQFVQYGDRLHSLSQSLADILTRKEQFFTSHSEVSEARYQDLKQGGKPDFDKDAALVQSQNQAAPSPDQLDVQWQERIEEFAAILEDILETCESHPEIRGAAGTGFLQAAEELLKMRETLPAADLKSQAWLLEAVNKINQTIQPEHEI